MVIVVITPFLGSCQFCHSLVQPWSLSHFLRELLVEGQNVHGVSDPLHVVCVVPRALQLVELLWVVLEFQDPVEVSVEAPRLGVGVARELRDETYRASLRSKEAQRADASRTSHMY